MCHPGYTVQRGVPALLQVELLKTLVYDTGNNGNLTGLIYQVGNLTTDSLFWGRPEDITMKRPYYVASSDSMSDLGGPLFAILPF